MPCFMVSRPHNSKSDWPSRSTSSSRIARLVGSAMALYSSSMDPFKPCPVFSPAYASVDLPVKGTGVHSVCRPRCRYSTVLCPVLLKPVEPLEKLDPLDLLSLLDSDDELESTEMLGPVPLPPEFEDPGPLELAVADSQKHQPV